MNIFHNSGECAPVFLRLFCTLYKNTLSWPERAFSFFGRFSPHRVLPTTTVIARRPLPGPTWQSPGSTHRLNTAKSYTVPGDRHVASLLAMTFFNILCHLPYAQLLVVPGSSMLPPHIKVRLPCRIGIHFTPIKREGQCPPYDTYLESVQLIPATSWPSLPDGTRTAAGR